MHDFAMPPVIVRILIVAPSIDRCATLRATTASQGIALAAAGSALLAMKGVARLAEDLCKIKRKDSSRCQCDLGDQSVRHVLLECPLREELRTEMAEKLFEAGVSAMLGEEEVLKESKAAPIVAKFMIASGLLGQFHSVDSVATGKEKGAGDGNLESNQGTTSARDKGSTT
ncbi:hypothetical protein PEX1_104900 [Penicillium expansum]|nr:hypothetical protein PEX1_104900 [Penicillium expansum]KGO44316.1 hypothetical protein PEXP_000070 [Penicillium expansum]